MLKFSSREFKCATNSPRFWLRVYQLLNRPQSNATRCASATNAAREMWIGDDIEQKQKQKQLTMKVIIMWVNKLHRELFLVLFLKPSQLQPLHQLTRSLFTHVWMATCWRVAAWCKLRRWGKRSLHQHQRHSSQHQQRALISTENDFMFDDVEVGACETSWNISSHSWAARNICVVVGESFTPSLWHSRGSVAVLVS